MIYLRRVQRIDPQAPIPEPVDEPTKRARDSFKKPPGHDEDRTRVRSPTPPETEAVSLSGGADLVLCAVMFMHAAVKRAAGDALQVAWIMVMEISEYLLKIGYGGDIARYRSKTPNKEWSLEKLEKAGAPFRASQLRNFINLYIEYDKFPEGILSLPPTCAVKLLQAPKDLFTELCEKAIQQGSSAKAITDEIQLLKNNKKDRPCSPSRQDEPQIASAGGTNSAKDPEVVCAAKHAGTGIPVSENGSDTGSAVAGEQVMGPVQLLQYFKRWVGVLAPIVVVPEKLKDIPADKLSETDVLMFDQAIFSCPWSLGTARDLVDVSNVLIRFLQIVRKVAFVVEKNRPVPVKEAS